MAALLCDDIISPCHKFRMTADNVRATSIKHSALAVKLAFEFVGHGGGRVESRTSTHESQQGRGVQHFCSTHAPDIDLIASLLRINRKDAETYAVCTDNAAVVLHPQFHSIMGTALCAVLVQQNFRLRQSECRCFAQERWWSVLSKRL